MAKLCTLCSPIRPSRHISAQGAKPRLNLALAIWSSSQQRLLTCAGIGTGDAGSRNADASDITRTVDSRQFTVACQNSVSPLLLGGFHDLAQFPFEVVDLITKPCGVFEPQLDRCLIHLLFEALDQPPQIRCCQIEVLLAA
jgi:hypothetical protein